MNRLDLHARRVSEGKDLQPAVEFARYVIWAVVGLCKATPQKDPLTVDGHLLEHTARQLERAVTERYRTNNTQAAVSLTELEKLNHKLDLLAGQMARMVPPGTAQEPALTVVSKVA